MKATIWGVSKEYCADYKASFYPGFTVACDQCGSQNVRIENDMGFSPESGGWGGIRLVCDSCGKETEIYDNC